MNAVLSRRTMKNRLIKPALVLLAVVIAFAAGYFIADTSAPHMASAMVPANTPAALGNGTDPETRHGSRDNHGDSDAAENVVLTPERARVQTFEILSEPNRIARMRKVCELLDRVTADNWREVIKAFAVQTTSEGRTFTAAWSLALERAGEVGGADAVTEALGWNVPSGVERAGIYLAGWAGAHPTEARAWFDAQPPELRERLLGNLVEGVARTKPNEALDMMLTQSESVVRQNMPGIISAALQNGGFSNAEALLANVINRKDVPDYTKSATFFYTAQRKIVSAHAAGDPAKTLDWFAPYLGTEYIGQYITRDLISNAAEAGASKVMQWLDTNANRMSPAQAGAAFPALAASWQAQAPEQFATWMNANPDHPQHDAMAQTAATNLLRSGKIEQAQQWKATIKSPEVQATLDEVIREAESRRRNPQQNPTK